MSDVLIYVREKEPAFKDVEDDVLTQYVADRQPKFLSLDPKFSADYQRIASTKTGGSLAPVSDNQLPDSHPSPEEVSASLNRPPVALSDGTQATVRSIGVGDDKGEWLIPTIVDGKLVSNEEATRLWKDGKNKALAGPFKSIKESNSFAQKLHEAEAQRILPLIPEGTFASAPTQEQIEAGNKTAEEYDQPLFELIAPLSAEEEQKLTPTLRGVFKSVRENANALTKPSMLGLLATGIGPGGVTAVGSGIVAKKAVAATFAWMMGKEVPQIAAELGAEMGKPEGERDKEKIAKLITDGSIATGFSVGAGKHAFEGFSKKLGAVPEKLEQLQADARGLTLEQFQQLAKSERATPILPPPNPDLQQLAPLTAQAFAQVAQTTPKTSVGDLGGVQTLPEAQKPPVASQSGVKPALETIPTVIETAPSGATSTGSSWDGYWLRELERARAVPTAQNEAIIKAEQRHRKALEIDPGAPVVEIDPGNHKWIIKDTPNSERRILTQSEALKQLDAIPDGSDMFFVRKGQAPKSPQTTTKGETDASQKSKPQLADDDLNALRLANETRKSNQLQIRAQAGSESNRSPDSLEKAESASITWLESLVRGDTEARRDSENELLGEQVQAEAGQDLVLGSLDSERSKIRTPIDNGKSVGKETQQFGTRSPQERERSGQFSGESGSNVSRPAHIKAPQTSSGPVGIALRQLQDMSHPKEAASGARTLLSLLSESLPSEIRNELHNQIKDIIYARKIIENAKVHADVSAQPGDVQRQVPAKEGGQRVLETSPPVPAQGSEGVLKADIGSKPSRAAAIFPSLSNSELEELADHADLEVERLARGKKPIDRFGLIRNLSFGNRLGTSDLNQLQAGYANPSDVAAAARKTIEARTQATAKEPYEETSKRGDVLQSTGEGQAAKGTAKTTPTKEPTEPVRSGGSGSAAEAGKGAKSPEQKAHVFSEHGPLTPTDIEAAKTSFADTIGTAKADARRDYDAPVVANRRSGARKNAPSFPQSLTGRIYDHFYKEESAAIQAEKDQRASAKDATVKPAAAETSTGGAASGIHEQTGSAIPAEADQTARTAATRQKRQSRSEQERPWDVIDELEGNLGGKLSLAKAQSILEGFKPTGAARKLFAKDGYAPDIAHQTVSDYKTYKSDAEFLQALNSAAKSRKEWREKLTSETKQIAEEESQHTAFVRDSKHPGPASDVLLPEDLFPGDEITIARTKLKVKGFEFDENGDVSSVELEDGAKYGTQHVKAGTKIHIDEKSLKKSSQAVDFAPKEETPPIPTLRPGEKTGEMFQGEDQPFNLSGEKATDAERIAAEKAKAEQITKEAKVIETKQQSDLFGGSELRETTGEHATLDGVADDLYRKPYENLTPEEQGYVRVTVEAENRARSVQSAKSPVSDQLQRPGPATVSSQLKQVQLLSDQWRGKPWLEKVPKDVLRQKIGELWKQLRQDALETILQALQVREQTTSVASAKVLAETRSESGELNRKALVNHPDVQAVFDHDRVISAIASTKRQLANLTPMIYPGTEAPVLRAMRRLTEEGPTALPDVERQSAVPPTSWRGKAETLAQSIEEWKEPEGTHLGLFGLSEKAYNGAVQVAADLVRAGGKTADAVAEAIKWIHEHFKDWAGDESGFTKHLTEKIEGLTAPLEEDVTSIKNEARQSLLAKHELAIEGDAPGESQQHWIDEANRLISADPEWTRGLVQTLIDNPRAITPTETAGLQIYLRETENAYNASSERLLEAIKSGDTSIADSERLRIAKLEERLQEIDKAGKRSGEEWSRTGTARQSLLRRDYSLATLTRRAMVDKGVTELTDAERTIIAEQAKKIAETQAALDKYVEESRERLAASEAARVMAETKAEAFKNLPSPYVLKIAERIGSDLKSNADAARERIKARLGSVTFGSGPLHELPNIKDYAIIGAEHIYSIGLDAVKWGAKMISEFGPKIEPHLTQLFVESQKLIEASMVGRVPDRAKRPSVTKEVTRVKSPESAIQSAQARIEAAVEKKELDAIHPLAKEIARVIIERDKLGEKDLDKLLDQLHPILKEVIPDMTREGARDALSGIGIFKLPSSDATLQALTDLRQQALLLGQAERIEQRRPLPPTGPQRQTISDTARRILQRVQELKRRFGVNVASPEIQLRSALQAREKYYANRMADLKAEIAAGELTVKTKSPSPTSAKLEALKIEYEKVKAEHAQLFKKPDLTDEQRLKLAIGAAERNERVWNQRLEDARKGLFDSADPKRKITSPELEAIKARTEAVRESANELRDLDTAYQERQHLKNLERQRKVLETSIAEKEKTMAGGVTEPGKKPVNRPADPKLEELMQKRDALNKQIQEARHPKKTEAEIALQSLKTRLKNSTADLLERRAKGDFESKPRKAIALDAEATKLKAENAKARAEFERDRLKDRLDNRSRGEKLRDYLLRVRRFSILSGISSIQRLASYSLQKLALRPLIEEPVATMLGKSPILREAFGRNPYHASVSLKSEVRYLKDAFMKGVKQDLVQVAKRGESDLAAALDPHLIKDQEWTGFFGRLHLMEKSPLIRASYERATERSFDWHERHGFDVTDLDVQHRIKVEAYQEALKEALVNPNWLSRRVNRFIKSLEEPDKVTGRPKALGKTLSTVLQYKLPIRNVPINYVGRAMEYITGTVTGSAKLGMAFRRGIENLKPEEANEISRHMTRGLVGAAVMALGYLNPDIFGGYYQPGEKRQKGDVRALSLRIYGVNVPHVLVHNPLVEAAQFGATIRRVADSKLRKKDSETQGLDAGLAGAMLGILDEAPYARSMVDYSKLRDPHQRGSMIGNELRSLLVPQLLQNIAQYTDKDESGEPITRRPKTWLQSVEVGIPGLRQTVPAK